MSGLIGFLAGAATCECFDEGGWGQYNPFQTFMSLRRIQTNPWIQLLTPETATQAGAGMMALAGTAVTGVSMVVGPGELANFARVMNERHRSVQMIANAGKAKRELDETPVKPRHRRERRDSPGNEAARRLDYGTPTMQTRKPRLSIHSPEKIYDS